jgi:hypothetical protein
MKKAPEQPLSFTVTTAEGQPVDDPTNPTGPIEPTGETQGADDPNTLKLYSYIRENFDIQNRVILRDMFTGAWQMLYNVTPNFYPPEEA